MQDVGLLTSADKTEPPAWHSVLCREVSVTLLNLNHREAA